ncbi:MAG: cell division ATP-binding protein FtsE [Clostridiales bacterium]|nr:cell division ATP-binding protein FtsE [Clostridiales bacterium]
MIEFKNVTKRYGNNIGLKNASVHIYDGDFVFLVGPSGAGKTTFIRLILKEINPDSGTIKLAGRDITRIGRREIPAIRQKVGMVFQDFRLLEKKTVYENVAFAMEVVHKRRREIKERVPYVLDLVDIKDKANRYPSELSAGEQQRVGIARALVNQPRVLICDEPTGNLDPVTAMDIMALLEEINARGTTILMVTHAKDIVDKMNKRVVAIDKGEITRDERGQYGFKTQYMGPDYINELEAALGDNSTNLTMKQRKTIYMEAANANANKQRATMYMEPAGADSDRKRATYYQPGPIVDQDSMDEMLSEYLDGEENNYD